MAVIGAKFDKQAINKDNADAGMKARGEAIAETLVRAVKDQATSLKRFLMDIATLDQQGRKAFRLAVNLHLKQIRAHVAAVKGTADEAAWATTARSAGVRLSEAVTFSRACDAGYSEALDTLPYHSCIGAARVFLQSESSTGPTTLRGRKPTPILDKVKAYLEKLDLKPEQWKEVDTLVHTMATIKTKPAVKAVDTAPAVARTVNTAANDAIERAAARINARDEVARAAAAAK